MSRVQPKQAWADPSASRSLVFLGAFPELRLPVGGRRPPGARRRPFNILPDGVAGLVATQAQSTVFLSTALTDLKPEDRLIAVRPQPAQMLFTFQTCDAPNGRATKGSKPKVLEAIRQSGLFFDISETPTPNGAVDRAWPSDFFADIAVPDATNHYVGLFNQLSGRLFADPDFRHAAAAP
jgi:hypothetical protein